jgi:hypothetical protein
MRKKPISSSRTAAVAEVALHAAAQLGQAARELHHVLELLRVAPRAPGVVVAVLLAPGDIRARRLEMAVRVRADPDVLPRGRNRELGDPLQHLRIVDPLAPLVDVAEAASVPAAADAGPGAVDAAEAAGHDCRSSRRAGL